MGRGKHRSSRKTNQKPAPQTARLHIELYPAFNPVSIQVRFWKPLRASVWIHRGQKPWLFAMGNRCANGCAWLEVRNHLDARQRMNSVAWSFRDLQTIYETCISDLHIPFLDMSSHHKVAQPLLTPSVAKKSVRVVLCFGLLPFATFPFFQRERLRVRQSRVSMIRNMALSV